MLLCQPLVQVGGFTKAASHQVLAVILIFSTVNASHISCRQLPRSSHSLEVRAINSLPDNKCRLHAFTPAPFASTSEDVAASHFPCF